MLNVQEGPLKSRKYPENRLGKQMCFQSMAEHGQRLSRHDIGKQVVPSTCGNNREGTVDDSWQLDGRHYQNSKYC